MKFIRVKRLSMALIGCLFLLTMQSLFAAEHPKKEDIGEEQTTPNLLMRDTLEDIQVMTVTPQDPQTQFSSALQVYYEKKPQKLAEYMRSLPLLIHYKFGHFLSNHDNFLSEQDRYKQAIKYFQKIAKLDATTTLIDHKYIPLVQFELAVIYERLKVITEVKKYLRKAANEWTFPEALFKLGVLNASEGKWSKAFQCWQRAAHQGHEHARIVMSEWDCQSTPCKGKWSKTSHDRQSAAKPGHEHARIVLSEWDCQSTPCKMRGVFTVYTFLHLKQEESQPLPPQQSMSTISSEKPS